jgi:hypothetical protein
MRSMRSMRERRKHEAVNGCTHKFYCYTCKQGVGDASYHKKTIAGSHNVVINDNYVKGKHTGERPKRFLDVIGSPVLNGHKSDFAKGFEAGWNAAKAGVKIGQLGGGE